MFKSIRIQVWAIVIAALGGVSTSMAAEPAAAPTADQASHTPAGSPFLQPAEWSARVEANRVILSPPESDVHLAIVEGISAADAKEAAAAAWTAYRPGASHPFKLLTAMPPREGWEEAAQISYETSPSEHLEEFAVARRKGTTWTVVILDGNEGTAEKRVAAINQVVASLRPAGYQRESFANRKANGLDPQRVQQMVDFVRNGARAVDVPGVGFALYAGGKVVYEGGVGVRELGKPEAVDAHTRFMIASNTKSMSTLLLAELVSEGRLRWDDSVTQVYPQFRLGSEATTRSVLIRHLVCACTGVPRKDMEWLFNTTAQTPASDTFVQLAATEPTSKFGEVFQYNNLMASAAGYIAAHLYYPNMELGAAYDRAVKEHVWDPLGMHDTTMSMNEALSHDHASPHGDDVDGKISVLSQDLNRAIAPFRPAGGAWSSAHDMILYARDELDEGQLPDGHRLVSKEALLARRARGVPISEDQWYGMGLMEDASRGVSVIHHGGDLAGYHSEMFMIPSAGVAAVILTNGDYGYELRSAFLRRLLELLYDGKPEAEGNLASAAQRNKAEQSEFRSKLTIPGNTKTLAALADRYENSDLGPLHFERKGGNVILHARAWSTSVVTRHNDDGSTSLIAIDPTFLGIEWVVGTEGATRTLSLRDGQHLYVFKEAK
jgi:CubicO group peptidase (beta-lactamase class C family)